MRVLGVFETKIFETKTKIVWPNVLWYSGIHLLAVYALYLELFHMFPSGEFRYYIFATFYGFLGGLGVTMGAHRLWSHHSFKATAPLRVFLMLCNSIAGQNDVIEWVRDHRVHHKFTDTDADPHNIHRGLFFAHVGWLCLRKHPQVMEKGRSLDISDLTSDPILAFQKRYYIPLYVVLCFLVPTLVPHWLWGLGLWESFLICGLLRYVVSLNYTWTVNSLAHMYGTRPYSLRTKATENWLVCFLTYGEGTHNYHHVFPYDYTTAECPLAPRSFNLTSGAIRLAALLGLAHDLRRPSPHSVLSATLTRDQRENEKE